MFCSTGRFSKTVFNVLKNIAGYLSLGFSDLILKVNDYRQHIHEHSQYISMMASILLFRFMN